MDPTTKKLLQHLYSRPRNQAALQAVRSHLTKEHKYKSLAKVLIWWSDKAPTSEASADALFEASEALELGIASETQMITCLRRALEKYPDHAAAALRLEEIYQKRGDYQGLAELQSRANRRRISLIDELERVDEGSDYPVKEPISRPTPPTKVYPSNPSRRLESLRESQFPISGQLSPLPAGTRPAIRPGRGSVRPLEEPLMPPTPAIPNVPFPRESISKMLRNKLGGGVENEIRKEDFEEATTTDRKVRITPPLEAFTSRPSSSKPSSKPRLIPSEPEEGLQEAKATEEASRFFDEEEAEPFEELFSLDSIIDDSSVTDSSAGSLIGSPGSRSGLVVEVIRIHPSESLGDRVLGIDVIRGLSGALFGYPFKASPFSIRLIGRKAYISTKEPIKGRIYRKGSESHNLPEEPLQLADKFWLTEGDRADIYYEGITFRIRLTRQMALPVEALLQPQLPLGQRYKVQAICSAIAIFAHIMALFGVALLNTLGVTFKVEDRSQEEIFAEIRAKPLEKRKIEKPKPPPRIRRLKKPIAKVPPPDRPAQIPKSLRKHLKRIAKTRPQDQTARVLSALTSPHQGEGQTLQEVVTNLDAIKGGKTAGAFQLGGTLAALDGISGVNIASSGGGEVGTLGGQIATKNLKGLEKRKKGSVRGRVRALKALSRVSGSLSRSQVLSEINRHMRRIQQCYERGLTRSPNLAGRVLFTWTITPKGSVSGVRQGSSTLGDIQVSNCISKVIQRMRFPRPKGGSVTVSYPFIFTRAQ